MFVQQMLNTTGAQQGALDRIVLLFPTLSLSGFKQRKLHP